MTRTNDREVATVPEGRLPDESLLDESLLDGLLPDAVWRRTFRRRLLAWFRGNARSLPWRDHPEVYRVWVSEIMLQQTQVATVVGYFERFMQAFPRIRDLAEAGEDDVLRAWEGLGYYRRARQLHKAARVVMREHGGRFPRDFRSVLALPGIGRYTAGAVLSIAFDQRHPILEANTIRLHSRLLAYRGDTASAEGQRLLWGFAESMLPRKNVGVMNQALMELGGEICSPRRPDCGRCPVGDLCPTRENGWQDEIPRASRKTRYEEVVEAAVVVWRRGRVLLRRCAGHERWAGLWDFPRFSLTDSAARNPAELDAQLASGTRDLTGIDVRPESRLTTIKHGVTRFRITLLCHQARYVSGRVTSGPDLKWIRPGELGRYALSVTGRRIAELIEQHERTASSESSSSKPSRSTPDAV